MACHSRSLSDPVSQVYSYLNKPWSYVDVRLAGVRQVLDVVIHSAKALYESYSWEDKWIDLFLVGQDTKMLDLISALEEFVKTTPQAKQSS